MENNSPTFGTVFCALIIYFILSSNNIHSQQIMKLDGTKITREALDSYLKKQMHDLKIPGLSIAIINDARIVYHRTFGLANTKSGEKVNNLSIFQASSMSKPVFAYLVLKMAEERVLDLDTPLYKYLPYLDLEYDERYKQITARMVLCHSSGLPNSSQGDKVELAFDPGTNFQYSGVGYNYLSRVLQKLLNKSPQEMEQFFQETVAKPLKMKHTSFVKNQYALLHKTMAHNANGIIENATPWWSENSFNTSGALHAEAFSYSMFLIGLMNEKGLKKESIDEMLKEQVKANSDLQKNITGWGLGLSRRTTMHGIIHAHVGNTLGYTSACMFDKERKFGYVFFTNYDEANTFYIKLEEVLFGDE